MRLRYKIILFVAGVLGCTALLQRCNRPTTFTGPAQISYQGDTIVVKQKGKPDFKEFQPDPKSTVITTDAQGHVTIKVRQVGVGFEPGVGIGYSNKTRLALDARLAYAKRFGAHVGLGLSLDANDYKSHAKLLDLVDPYVGASYVPWLRFPNTSVVFAYTVSQHVFGFVRFRF